MRIVRGALALMMVLGAAPALADDVMKKAQENFKPIPSIVPAVKNNAVTHEKVELGKMLFFDPRLSASEIIRISPPAESTPVRPRSATARRRGRAARRQSTTPSSISPSSGTGGRPTSRLRQRVRSRRARR